MTVELDLAHFDFCVGGVLMLDPRHLVPPDPHAAWLLGETADGTIQRDRIESARVDLERFRTGWVPSEEALSSAPGLTDWRPIFEGSVLVLAGTVTGHPSIGERRRVVTSALVAIEVSGHWARTISRFYRLM